MQRKAGHTLSRRRMLQATAGLPLLANPMRGASAATASLKDAAARAGLKFGSDSDIAFTKAPDAYAQLFIENCNLLAPILSWSAVARTPDTPEPSWEDPNIGFACQHGMQLTGGHLLWHLRTPDWFARIGKGAPAQAAVERHIHQLASHYAGQVYSWNVVNEAIETRHGEPNGLRPTLFDEQLGPDYMEAAFHAARAADPRALLVYNDAGMEMDTPAQASRRDALMRLLDRLQRNAPIDGVGLQSHISLDDTTFNPDAYQRFLQNIAARGLKILITELDVFDKRGGPDIIARDKDVSQRYKDFLSVAVAQLAVKSVVVWGLSDRYTWITPDRDGPFSRPDKLPARPLPFDASFAPKPAFTAILNAFRAAPPRSQI